LSIIYKDLKAENIVISKDGLAKLTDFGLSAHQFKTDQEINHNRSITLHISAPEVLQGGAYTNASDWWSFGCLLYEMSIGSPPFNGISNYQIRQAILNQPPFFPHNFDPVLKDLIQKLLDKDPINRLSNTKQIKSHPYFSGVNFTNLKAPCKPQLTDEFDTYYFD